MKYKTFGDWLNIIKGYGIRSEGFFSNMRNSNSFMRIVFLRERTKTAWRWWAKSIGEKASKCDRESDVIASIRTIIFLSYLITNCFIVAGVIRHWNDLEYTRPITIQQQ